jgi:hypothetical protein
MYRLHSEQSSFFFSVEKKWATKGSIVFYLAFLLYLVHKHLFNSYCFKEDRQIKIQYLCQVLQCKIVIDSGNSAAIITWSLFFSCQFHFFLSRPKNTEGKIFQ